MQSRRGAPAPNYVQVSVLCSRAELCPSKCIVCALSFPTCVQDLVLSDRDRICTPRPPSRCSSLEHRKLARESRHTRCTGRGPFQPVHFNNAISSWCRSYIMLKKCSSPNYRLASDARDPRTPYSSIKNLVVIPRLRRLICIPSPSLLLRAGSQERIPRLLLLRLQIRR
jgi:hypothetical protein